MNWTLIRNFVWQEAQTLVLAGAFAVLVWVYAEGETISNHELRLDVELVAPTGQQLVIEPVMIRQVVLLIRASTSQWTQIKMLEQAAFTVEVTDDPTQRVQMVNLRDELRTDARLAAKGVTVESVRVDNPPVVIEKLEARRVAIDGDAGDVEVVRGSLGVKPVEALVEAPESWWKETSLTRLYASLAGVNVQTLPENLPVTQEVPITLPQGVEANNVTITPARAQVTFVIVRRTETYTVPLVQIQAVLPPSETARYTVELSAEDGFVRDMVVTGPRDLINQLKENQSAVLVALRLTADELDRGITSKQLEIHLPAGVTLAAPPPTVNLRVMRKP